MNDQNLMENLLLLEKGVCDLYMHGAIESSTQNVNSAFCSALNTSLQLQDGIYTQMQQKGWYQTDTAEAEKINTVKQKFAAQA